MRKVLRAARSSLLNQYQLSSTAFWEAMVKTQIAHPINNMTPKFNTQVKYVKRISFVLHPRLTNESDANVGHSRQMNSYILMNRVCMYDWTNQATVAWATGGRKGGRRSPLQVERSVADAFRFV
jgi:hypothetical protein